ncbi:hypothetical protein GKZ89_12525 [Bacillus mangrovi]|uniref:Uncharacterized protein n=1 Tax=Metabacillus mangrovi TaxID=1491830 RepID=A0A7X2S5U2_9BACI|nr:hypothetical protein [Metabacillus mangrovi]MTH54228.1 hypothetical protein [Metabacillus mangrovi]
MSDITFMASSKKFVIPDEIEQYNNRRVFEREEDFMQLWVQKAHPYWLEELEKGLFILPYIYEISGVGNALFLLYLEKYMETGDELELLYIPNQHAFRDYERRMLDNPRHFWINTGSLDVQGPLRDVSA